MRTQMRTFARLTPGYSINIENHIHMVSLYTVWFNWMSAHKARRMTPAMAAGLTEKLMETADLVRLIDDAEIPATVRNRVAMVAFHNQSDTRPG